MVDVVIVGGGSAGAVLANRLSADMGRIVLLLELGPGTDDEVDAVVDLQGRVRGMRGLRKIDASIFPDAVSTATNVTTIAVAEHLAAQIS